MTSRGRTHLARYRVCWRPTEQVPGRATSPGPPADDPRCPWGSHPGSRRFRRPGRHRSRRSGHDRDVVSDRRWGEYWQCPNGRRYDRRRSIGPGDQDVVASERGRLLFLSTCASCHGPDGRGRRRAVARDGWHRCLGLLPPHRTDAPSAPGQPAARQGAVLGDEDIADLVAYGATIGSGRPSPTWSSTLQARSGDGTCSSMTVPRVTEQLPAAEPGTGSVRPIHRGRGPDDGRGGCSHRSGCDATIRLGRSAVLGRGGVPRLAGDRAAARWHLRRCPGTRPRGPPRSWWGWALVLIARWIGNAAERRR